MKETQLEDLVAKARTVADNWSKLKLLRAGKQLADSAVNLTQALDDLVDASDRWTLATDPTTRVEPLADLTAVHITGGPRLGLTGVVVMQHDLANYEVEVFDDRGRSLGTEALRRDWLDPIV